MRSRDGHRRRPWAPIAALALVVAAAIAALTRGSSPTAVTPARPETVGDTRPQPPPLLAVASRKRTPPPAEPDVAPPPKEKTLDEIRAEIDAHRWKSAREAIDAIRPAHPDEADPARKALDEVRDEFERRRKAYFAELTGTRFPQLIRTCIDKRVVDDEQTFTDTQAWLRKDCVDAAFESLLRELQDADECVTPEDVKNFWECRPRTDESWKPHGSSNLARLTGKSGSGIINRDAWWRGESLEQRREDCFSIVIEKSGLFEVAGKNEPAWR